MYEKIKISPVSFVTLLKCEIVKRPNQHIKIKAEGYIDTLEDMLYTDWKKEEIQVYFIDEKGEKERVFCGMMELWIVEEMGALKKLYFEAVSYTVRLDWKKRVRVFQKQNQRFEEIITFFADSNTKSSCIFTEDLHKKTDSILVQYQETDWEFLIRVASYLNTVIIPDCTNNRACYYLGLPKIEREFLDESSHYRVQENIAEWKQKKNGGLETLGIQDVTDYIVSSDKYMELCTPVEFQGKSLRVAEIRSKWENGEVLHEYRLRTDYGFKTVSYFNPFISGLSMKGRVEDVKEEKVRIKVLDTEGGFDENSHWFDFATVYASGKNALWYCMPEKGDMIRIYFPDSCEKNAFVLSAVHLEQQRGWKLEPEKKFIRTVDDKEIRLEPECIKITNHKGMSIELNDKTGILIKGNKDIQIRSSGGINLDGGEDVNIIGKSGVFLKQNQNILAVCDGILDKASKVEHR